jgi:hypothetical protein
VFLGHVNSKCDEAQPIATTGFDKSSSAEGSPLEGDGTRILSETREASESRRDEAQDAQDA